jgi:hypothetical protein
MKGGHFTISDGKIQISGKYYYVHHDEPGYIRGAIYINFTSDKKFENKLALFSRKGRFIDELITALSWTFGPYGIDVPAYEVNGHPIIIFNSDLDDSYLNFVGNKCRG